MDQKEAAKRIQKDFEDLFYTAVGFSILSGRRIYTTIKDITKDSEKQEQSGSEKRKGFIDTVKPFAKTAESACKLLKHFGQSAFSNNSKHRQESGPKEG